MPIGNKLLFYSYDMFHNILNALSGEATTQRGQRGQRVSHHGADQNRRTAAPVEKETVRHHRQQEVQPVIEREIEQTEIQQVIQPVQERQERVVHHDGTTLDTEEKTVRDEIGLAEAGKMYEEQQAAIKAEHSSHHVEETVGEAEVITKEPIIHETVNRHVIEEVQPVIERTIDEVHINHVEQPIKEHHVAAPIINEPINRAPISADAYHEEVADTTQRGPEVRDDLH